MAPARDLLDPRQREAAAILLSALDLPAEITAVGKLWKEAARVCPGIMAETAMIGNRAAQLQRVREIVNQLLGEIER